MLSSICPASMSTTHSSKPTPPLSELAFNHADFFKSHFIVLFIAFIVYTLHVLSSFLCKHPVCALFAHSVFAPLHTLCASLCLSLIATSDDEIHSLTLEGQAAGDSVVRVVVQDRLLVLPAVEHANDGNQIAGHVEGDRGALAVVRDAQAAPRRCSVVEWFAWRPPVGSIGLNPIAPNRTILFVANRLSYRRVKTQGFRSWTRRKPPKRLLADGPFLPRYAERRLRELLRQAPPRTTA